MLRVIYFVCLSLFLALLSGCSEKVVQTSHLSLMGESENWKVESYQIDITSETVKAGDGRVLYKGEQDFYSDAYILSTYAVINHEDVLIFRTSASGNVPHAMNDLTTGTIEGSTYVSPDGETMTSEMISEIYMLIEWEKLDEVGWLEEKIELYRNRDS